MTPPLALLAALCLATLAMPWLATPRGLFAVLSAIVSALDAAAVLCGAVVLAVDALAWALGRPFLAAARACLRASRRLTSGAPGRPGLRRGDEGER